MFNFIIKRLIFGIFVLLGVVIVVFFIFNVLPGDPALQALNNSSSPEQIEMTKKEMGWDKPVGVQLLNYINDLSPISRYEISEKNQKEYKYSKILGSEGKKGWVFKSPYLGRAPSMQNQKISKIIYEALIPTFWLSLLAIVIATVIGIPMGVYASLNQGKFVDSFLIVISVIGISMPSYVIGSILLVLLKAGRGGLYELEGGEIVAHYENLILPAITLGIMPLSIIVQLTRSSMLDVMKKDYIRTAKAKGLSFSKVVLKHGLKNALNPVITAVTGWFAALIAGALFVEIIFEYNGIGFVLKQAIKNIDYPLVMGIVIVISSIFVVVNIFVDVLYAILDPRVKLK